MFTACWPNSRVRTFRPGRWSVCFLAALAATGCGKEKQKTAPDINKPPKLHLIRPELRKITRVVGQPSFVQSYERTSIYPKVTAFVKKWNVDIGDKVQKGDVLADLFVPELRELWGTKKATVDYDKERLDYARKLVRVAEAKVKAADAHLVESQRMLAVYKAQVERWQSEVNRLDREVRRKVVAPQILLESQKQLEADTARWEAQKATVANADADLLAQRADLEAAMVDVRVADARVAVAQSEAKRLEAWVGYLKLYAPYDGIVVERNVNSWDFVLPQTGDPTAEVRAPHLSPSGKAAPVYVIDRTDIVRIYVDVPERDADYIRIGSPAKVKIWAFRDEWMSASVTRLSWALNPKSRTLRAEIDLPNYEQKIRPGMYAYGKVIVERPDIRALPKSALTHAGGKSYVWFYKDGKAQRTEVQTGVTSGKWIEIISRGTGEKYHGHEEWAPMTGSEQVLIGPKLTSLTDDAKVEIDDTPAKIEEDALQERDNAM